MASRYVVGIDLGTTNCAVSYVDTGIDGNEEAHPATLDIPQVVQAGTVESRPLLPSFLYLPGENELPAGSLKLPWDADRDYTVGEFARNHGNLVPTRLVSSAKSWLCHNGIDRQSPVLPWKAPEDSRRVSPIEAATRYLRHLVEAWNDTIAKNIPENHLEEQEIILTVPASFDTVAKDLTVEAARAAGLEHLTLLEEPQAAFYAWIDANRDQWREQVDVGDLILVCDVGGGTTDLTLIAVSEESGELELTRLAVGDHILLGGDNMDLALAHAVGQQFAAKGTKLDAGQQLMLWHSCRTAKEQLFQDPEAQSKSVTVLGRGRSVIGGTLKGELTREEMDRVLLEGFLPPCGMDEQPHQQRAAGFQELGLPYASDAAISRHLAWFLSRQQETMLEAIASKKGKKKAALPTAVLFNGGVFKADSMRQRVLAVLNQWSDKVGSDSVKDLESNHLDLAVSRGAAYYGMVRRGRGVRIRGGTARSYYIGIETALPAVPGAPRPLKYLCVAPFGMEEGTESDVPGQEFGLIVGEPVDFRFFGSTVRKNDPVGTMIDEWDSSDIDELTPLSTKLETQKSKEGQTVPVHLHSRVTEIGTLELSCLSRDEKDQWKLELNVREKKG